MSTWGSQEPRFLRYLAVSTIRHAHVKAQNWTAIALDFVFVVVGVFVGLQVANWNDARSDIKLERDYLTRLAADMEVSFSKFSETAEVYKKRESTSAELAYVGDLALPKNYGTERLYLLTANDLDMA